MEVIQLKDKIIQVLSEIRPRLQADGGDIEFVDVEDGIVKVRLQGACAHCAMSQMTIQMGVERILKQRVPEVEKVVAV